MQSVKIPIEEFKGKTQCIHWIKVEGNIEKYAGSKQPIFAVPYFSEKNNLLVIDGNHRLTYAVKYNLPDISTLIISEQSVIEYQIFSSSFDKMLYIFNNELIRFGNRTEKDIMMILRRLRNHIYVGKDFNLKNKYVVLIF